MNGLRNFDLLSTAPHLYIFEKKTYQTIVGASLSMTVIILSILCLFGFGIDIFYKKKPISVLSREYMETPVINRSNLMIALNPTFPTGEPVKDLNKKMSISMLYLSANASNKVTPTSWVPIPLTSCIDSQIYKNNTYNFAKNLAGNPKDAACIPDEFQGGIRGKVGDAISDVYMLYIT
jgi:hypothetical protein